MSSFPRLAVSQAIKDETEENSSASPLSTNTMLLAANVTTPW
jgi:hypothetical protein